jgi:hypothetical protein
MNQKTVILTVILFALIVVGMFVYASLKNQEIREQAVSVWASLMAA